ncbi:MAG: lipopolysaccharide biosynthesis protein [Acidaminococcaceae bacterium]
MEKKITAKTVFVSLFWKLIERIGYQGINFTMSIILARLLSPEDYGFIAIITIFITISNVFVQSGFNAALIQKEKIDEVDLSTVFYTSIIISCILYAILYLYAPYIANFYGDMQMTSVVRVLSLMLFFGAINSIQIAKFAREMAFQHMFYSSFGAAIFSGILGIFLAYLNFGIWALVTQQLSYQFCFCFISFFTTKWRPHILFSTSRLLDLLSYGTKILLANLLNTLFMNIRSLIIGRIYNVEILGYFERGKQFPAFIVNNIDGTIQSVMFPAYATEQGNQNRVKEMVRRSITISAFIIFPAMVLLVVLADIVVRVLLTDKWLPCVPFLQIFCICFMIMPIHTANIEAIKALGYSGIILKIEIVKKIIELLVLIISLNYGIYAVAFGAVITSLISLPINSYPSLKIINYNYKEQIKDIIPSLALALTMGFTVHNIHFFHLSYSFILIVKICIGTILYLLLASIFKLESYVYLLNVLKTFIKNK